MRDRGIMHISRTITHGGAKVLFVISAAFSLCCLILCGGCEGGPPAASPTGSAQGSDSFGFTIGSKSGNVGSIITIPVVLDSDGSTRAVTCTLTYDPTILAPGDSNTLKSIQDSSVYLGSGIASRRKWGSNGNVTLYFAYSGSNVGQMVANVPFKIIASGTSNLTFSSSVYAYDNTMNMVQRKTRGINGRIAGR